MVRMFILFSSLPSFSPKSAYCTWRRESIPYPVVMVHAYRYRKLQPAKRPKNMWGRAGSLGFAHSNNFVMINSSIGHSLAFLKFCIEFLHSTDLVGSNEKRQEKGATRKPSRNSPSRHFRHIFHHHDVLARLRREKDCVRSLERERCA